MSERPNQTNLPKTQDTLTNQFTKLKTLATRTLLSATLAMGEIATGSVEAMAQTANPALTKEQSTLIARSELSESNKDAIDSAFTRAMKLSDHLKIPIRFTTNDDKLFFKIRDNYTPSSDTQTQIGACTGTRSKVDLTEYGNNQRGLMKGGFLGDKCVLQLLLDLFLKAGDPIDNFKSQYPEIYSKVNEKITQFQFSEDQYFKLVNDLANLVDNTNNKNRKEVIIYVSEEMSYKVEKSVRDVMSSLNLPALRKHNITFSTDKTYKLLIKQNPASPDVKIKGRKDVIIINLPLFVK